MIDNKKGSSTHNTNDIWFAAQLQSTGKDTPNPETRKIYIFID
jgi:hypothetical protein